MAERDWLKRTEQYLLVGSGVGTAAALTVQNAALASVPLTVLAAVGVMNRNRMERQLEAAQEKLGRQQRQVAHRMTNLSKQVTALPSPEAMTNFQRSVLDRNNRAFVRFSQQMNHFRNVVEQQLQQGAYPELSQIQKDIAQLQDQCAYACSSVQQFTAANPRLSMVPRLEATEARLSQVKNDLTQIQVQLETFGTETKSTVNHLQDWLVQIDRRLQDLPATLDTGSLRTELAQTSKAIVQLVPRSEFANLATHVQDLTRQQADLQRALVQLPVGPKALPEASLPGVELKSGLGPLDHDLHQLGTTVRQLQQQVNQQETAGNTQEQVQRAVSTYLGKLKAQLAQLEGVTQSLSERQQHLSQQLDQVLPDHQQARIRKALGQVAHRLNQADAGILSLQDRLLQQGQAGGQVGMMQWIVDFPTAGQSEQDRQMTASRQALDQALDQAQHRLLLVWPWASYVTIDDALLEKFTQTLNRGCRLEVGWCHRGDRQEGRLARRINQRWGTESSQLTLLKAALNKLLPLREQFPDQFRFKIIGTDESFLVCGGTEADPAGTSFAILSLRALPAQSAVFPHVDLKLRTADPHVVSALIQRFENPAISPGDGVAFFNRGTTRHDLRDQPGAIADYTHVLGLHPDDAIALNNRGVAHLELGHDTDAEIDLGDAIICNPKLFAAYCNRGWLRLEKHRFQEAVADFTKAIEIKPQLPMAYVYRGSALQRLGDTDGALQDYSDAIACGEPLALPYFYRSAVYQSQGDRQRAIADLELASAQLEAQGDQETLSSVQRTLSRLHTINASPVRCSDG